MKHEICISPLLQSLLLEYCVELPFDKGAKLLIKALPLSNVGASQAQRLVQYYGSLAQTQELLEASVVKDCKENSTKLEKDNRVLAKRQALLGSAITDHCNENYTKGEKTIENGKTLCVQLDGGMVLTDDGYQEVKLGRVFSLDSIKKVSSDNEGVERRNEITNSDYIAHLGDCDTFTLKLDRLIDAHIRKYNYTKILIISDGAKWIEKWALSKYPDAIIILDFYHALEHFAEFASLVIKSKEERKKWIDSNKELLKEGEIEAVLEQVRSKSKNNTKEIEDARQKVINYYTNNRYRMDYNEYRDKGYIIGSGAIESAISNVIQRRCKLVGQRWTKRVQAVLDIRAIFLSNKGHEFGKLIASNMGFRYAA